mgnify:CR=1 FL=1
MNKVVLDASALLALIKNEPGAQIVEAFLGNIIMSSVNLAEVGSVLIDCGMTAEECEECIEPFIDSIVPFDTDQAFIVASLKKLTKHKGLSLGDRACIALGIKSKAKIYTADKVWAELNIKGADIGLIR